MKTVLTDQNQKLIDENKNLKEEVSVLKDQIVWFQRQVFGQKADRIIGDLDAHKDILHFSFIKDMKEDKPKPPPKKISGHLRHTSDRNGKDKISFPDDLPVEITILDLPEEKKICSKTGLSLKKIGEEITRKLAFKPGSFYIKEIVRPKYVNPKFEEEGIMIAELPESFLSKARIDESFLANILTKKFADHLPLYRINEILAREGVKISRQLLSQWVLKTGELLKPLHDAMRKKLIKSGTVFIDETPIDLLVKGKGKAHKAYMWVLAGDDPPYSYYDFRFDRKHHNAYELLKDFNGVMHSDKYGAYQTLGNRSNIIWCPCWAHIRRKFIDAESGDPEFRMWIFRKIRYLYMLEKIAKTRSSEGRLKIRQEKEVPIIEEIIEATKKEYDKKNYPSRSKFHKALGYLIGLIPHLKNYTEHASARIDNNTAERVIRPLAIGRKNWMFVGSERGGQAAAVILSLVQSCRKLKINPQEYLAEILPRFLGHNFNRIDEFLPDKWLELQSKN